MKYTLNNTALPVFYADYDLPYIVSPVYSLKSKPISALHYHDIVELGLCISGKGNTCIGNKIYSYLEGSIQVVPPNIPHLSNSDDGIESKWIFISFDPNSVLKNAGIFSREYTTIISRTENFICGIFDNDEFPELLNAIKAIIDADKRRDEFRNVSIALAIAQFMIASARLSDKVKDENVAVAKGKYEKIVPALDYIENNLDNQDALSEKLIAECCDASVSTLRRLFLKHTGYSPKAFIIRSRMAHAEYLLRKTSLSILDISVNVGYNDISGFNRTFRSLFGMSPLQYRKQYK